MKDNIRNKDKQGKRHGKKISYHPNGNIRWISNFHHGKRHGYLAWFYKDKSIQFKQYCNMGKWIYDEYHYDNQIQINI